MIIRLAKYLLPYRRHLAASLLFVFLYALSSAALVYLGTSLISSLFESGEQMIPEAVSETESVPSGSFIDDLKGKVGGFLQRFLLTGDKLTDLRNLCIALVLAALLKNLFFFLQGFFAAYIEQGITKRLRDTINEHLQKLSLQYFHISRTGNLISTAINDVLKIHETFNAALNHLVRDPLLILVYLTVMLAISWKITLFAAAVFPVILLLIYQAGRLVRRHSQAAQEALADVSSSLEETINNVRIVRAYSAEPYEMRKFRSQTLSYFATMLKINRIRLLVTPVNEVLGVTAASLILWYGGKLVLADQFLEPRYFLLYLLAMFSIINPAKAVSNVHIRVLEGLAAAKRIFDLLDTKPTVVESASPVKLPGFEKEITFNSIYFEYEAGETVLQDIDLTVRKGEIVALVGPSGAGKSTLVDLLCRFHDPVRGSIRIDGVDIRDVSFASLRGLLGVVTQETILFNDSVANNIAYPNGRKDQARLEESARAANAHDFIMDMPRRYDTVIGNRGMMVSGGQRQRLAIARALMKDPQILIFDEATSSLDTESERLVQEAIDRLMAGRTTIVIAHRLSTILHADKILVIKGGRIVEQGKHLELLSHDGVYRRLYDLQFERNHAATTHREIAATGESD